MERKITERKFQKRSSDPQKSPPHRGGTARVASRGESPVRRQPRDEPRKGDFPRNEIPDDVCFGRQPVLDILRHSPKRCLKISIANNVRPPFLDELTDLARAAKVVFQMVAPEFIDGLCPGVNHQGVACRVSETDTLELEPFLKSLPSDRPVLIVVLDHIEDPHNLGAIVRSAEAAGAAGVVFGKRRAALPGGTVMKVSAGASLRVPLVGVVNISRAIKEIQEAGYWTVGLENKPGAGDSLWNENKIPPRSALVVGAEGEGLSRLAAENCDDLAYIPMSGKTGSLNASVACAIAMFEWRRNLNL